MLIPNIVFTIISLLILICLVILVTIKDDDMSKMDTIFGCLTLIIFGLTGLVFILSFINGIGGLFLWK